MRTTLEDTLFSTTPVAPVADARNPVIVVGLPRSGSSFLSHVLSQFDDYYVYDDLYMIELARSLGVKGRLTPEQLRQMLHALGWQIRARLRRGLYAIPNMREEEVEPMNAALLETFSEHAPTPLDLQEEWLLRLAHRKGARNWGYKQPRAFIRLDALRARYPGLKVIFLLRQPHDVFASYKHMPMESEDGDPRRFHILPYAYYWRAAARALLRERKAHPDDTLFISFSELTADPTGTAGQIAAFLGVPAPAEVTVPPRPNSSHTKTAERPRLTGLEGKITNAVCGQDMAALGFATPTVLPKAADLVDFLRISGRFLAFHTYHAPIRKIQRRRRLARNAAHGA